MSAMVISVRRCPEGRGQMSYSRNVYVSDAARLASSMLPPTVAYQRVH